MLPTCWMSLPQTIAARRIAFVDTNALIFMRSASQKNIVIEEHSSSELASIHDSLKSLKKPGIPYEMRATEILRDIDVTGTSITRLYIPFVHPSSAIESRLAYH